MSTDLRPRVGLALKFNIKARAYDQQLIGMVTNAHEGIHVPAGVVLERGKRSLRGGFCGMRVRRIVPNVTLAVSSVTPGRSKPRSGDRRQQREYRMTCRVAFKSS